MLYVSVLGDRSGYFFNALEDDIAHPPGTELVRVFTGKDAFAKAQELVDELKALTPDEARERVRRIQRGEE